MKKKKSAKYVPVPRTRKPSNFSLLRRLFAEAKLLAKTEENSEWKKDGF